MDGVILSLVLLSVPGMIFQSAREMASRVSVRRQRDVVRLLSELVLPSIAILFVTFMLMDLLDRSGSRALLDLVDGSLSKVQSFNEVSVIMGRLAGAFTVIAGLATLLGLIWGQTASWIGDRTPFHHPLFRMTAGLRPPIITASVLSNTQIGEGRLVYEGTLDSIQLGPEGRVDLIVLKAPRKSLLRQPSPRQRTPDPGSDLPRAIQPFTPIGGEQASPDDLLFVESEDIANVFFHTSPGGGGHPLERFLASRFAPRPLSAGEPAKHLPEPPDGLTPLPPRRRDPLGSRPSSPGN